MDWYWVKTTWGKIKNFFNRFLSLLKIIFSVWELRISVWKWFVLYFLGLLLLLLIWILLWVDFSKIWYDNYNTTPSISIYIISITRLLYLRLYLSPKRARDHWFSRWWWLIPIVNAFIFVTPWDKWENQYWERPSFSRKLWEWRPWKNKKIKDFIMNHSFLINSLFVILSIIPWFLVGILMNEGI